MFYSIPLPSLCFIYLFWWIEDRFFIVYNYLYGFLLLLMLSLLVSIFLLCILFLFPQVPPILQLHMKTSFFVLFFIAIPSPFYLFPFLEIINTSLSQPPPSLLVRLGQTCHCERSKVYAN